MRTSVTSIRCLSLAAMGALLASCSGNSTVGAGPQSASISPLETMSHLDGRLTSTSIAAGPSRAIHPDRRKSWISPDIRRAPRLLFGSDYGTGDLDIFSLPTLALKATITGLSGPQGMCSDNDGNVWAANTNTQQLLEFSRSGLLLNTIDDSYGYPVGCAVNLKNGDIAVFNIFNVSGAGGIYVYACPSCTPTEVTIPGGYFNYFGGYDPRGNLYVDGKDSSGSFTVGEVPAGSSSGFVISVAGGTLYFPGFVQWYKPGNYLAVADQLCNDSNASCIYWIAISGSSGTITGQTTLLNPAGGQICDMVQGVLNPVGEKNVVGSDYEYCGYASSSFDRWLYPAGGLPTNSANFTSSYSEPIGAAISVK
jgi:hypothetical protein